MKKCFILSIIILSHFFCTISMEYQTSDSLDYGNELKLVIVNTECNPSLSAPSIFSYWNNKDSETLYTPATLASLEMVRTEFNQIPANLRFGNHILATPAHQDTILRTQLWFSKQNNYYQVRLDDDMQQQQNRIELWEHLNDVSPLFFDGPNQEDFCIIGLNTQQDCKLLVINKNNPVSDYTTNTKSNAFKKACAKLSLDGQQLKSIMMHYYAKRLVTCTHHTNTNNYTLYLYDLRKDCIPSLPYDKTAFENVQAPPEPYEVPLIFVELGRCVLPYSVGYIGRLTEHTYLALNEHGKIVSIALKDNNAIEIQEKKIMYNTTQNALQETFTHLAIDNCTEVYGEEKKDIRNASSLAAINQTGELFWGSFEKFKNTITLYKVNNQLFNDVKQLWAIGNQIGILRQPDTKQNQVLEKYYVHNNNNC